MVYGIKREKVKRDMGIKARRRETAI